MYSLLFSVAFAGLVPMLVAAPVSSPNSSTETPDISELQLQRSPLDKRESRTSAPTGCLSVGSGLTYTSVGDAIKSLGDSTDSACIFITSGTYEEQLTIDYGGALTLYGESSDTSSYNSNTVLITHTINSADAGTLDKSSTIDITADGFTMYNINVENGYGQGHQAVAVTANADRLGFYGSTFTGYQDTLYVKAGTQYYSGCLIQGAVDYIFGDASVWITNSTIQSIGAGSITASSRTTSDEETWYVFDSVTVTSNRTDLTGKVTLGRPWRVEARVMYQDSELGDIISAAGWATMAENATPLYYEYNNTGAGADTSDRDYETVATAAITIETVLGSDYADWVDSVSINAANSSSSTTSSIAASATSSQPASSVASPATARSSAHSSSIISTAAVTSTPVSSSGDPVSASATSTASVGDDDDDACESETDESTVKAATATTSAVVTKAASKTSSGVKSTSTVTRTTASGATCTPSAGGSADTDDTPAIVSSITECGNGGTIVIPAGKTYYINSVLNFTGCSACTLQLDGTLKASSDLDYWEGRTAIIYVDVAGLKISGSGTLDGNGQTAWDRFASDSSYKRPTLFYVDGGNDLVVEGINTINPPNVFYSVVGGSTNVAFSNLNMSAESTSDNLPKNTDGFDIGESQYVTLTGITIRNDDDCVAFKSGADYTTVTDITCIGSHGLSVGSLGKGAGSNDTVSNIYVSNATMISSTKAVGIKTYPGGSEHGTAHVTNVTYTDIVVQDCQYAIQISSCYGYSADDSYCTENPGDAVLTDILFENFSGKTSNKSAPATADINCGKDGTCGVKIENYDVTSSSETGEVLCANTPSDLGVACTSGASG